MDDFALEYLGYERFIVQNICNNKTIKIFNYPIPVNQCRDLLRVPGISSGDIKSSLARGELYAKIKVNEVKVIFSDIQNIQFNDNQKLFLQNAGITIGLDAGGSGTLNFAFKQGQSLIGTINSINRIFTTSEQFIQGSYSNNIFKIKISHNGRELFESVDYMISNSGGINGNNTFDTIIFTSLTPQIDDIIFCDYCITQ